MKKDFNHGDDLYKALLVYQNTPLENGFSAAQLLMEGADPIYQLMLTF